MGVSTFVKIFLFLFFVPLAKATISQSFYKHIQDTYGQKIAQLIARNDFGSSGSYGGGNHKAGSKTNRIPVIFVHGLATKASSTALMASAFKSYGYSDEELYATTYGINVGAIPLQIAIRCIHVQGVRALIKAVASYTNSKVDAIGYSLGGPILRKAILGGNCVDTREDLGPPLTNIVNTYLGVAGPQHGAMTCGSYGVGVCNLLNGIGCGSKFLRDINSRSRYEGQNTYVLQSTADNVVGLNACGTRTSEISGATKIVTINGLNHIQTCASTSQIQYNLLNKGTQ